MKAQNILPNGYLPHSQNCPTTPPTTPLTYNMNTLPYKKRSKINEPNNELPVIVAMNTEPVTSKLDATTKTPSVSPDTSSKQAATCRKRTIDETLLPPEEARKLELRRAYNRECASRARKRTKQLVSQLQTEVADLQQDKSELRKANAILKNQLSTLEKQYRAVLLKNAVNCTSLTSMTRGVPLTMARQSFASPLQGLQLASLIANKATDAQVNDAVFGAGLTAALNMDKLRQV